MFKIGLTGGIGTGKTTVSQCFRELGIEIIDADEIAHKLTQPGTIYYQAIIKKFGSEILNEKKQIQRKKLRQIIFDDPSERSWLEQLLHPPILQELIRLSQNAKGSYCILVIPLLIEKQLQSLVDRILIIDSSESIQIERIKKRDEISEEEIKKILKSQTSTDIRLKYAHDSIVNTGNLIKLKQEVLLLHKKYTNLSQTSF